MGYEYPPGREGDCYSYHRSQSNIPEPSFRTIGWVAGKARETLKAGMPFEIRMRPDKINLVFIGWYHEPEFLEREWIPFIDRMATVDPEANTIVLARMTA